MTILIILFLATCFLSYSNGANDNFKGVATLFGSKTTNYKYAIWWATITTFAGSLASIFFAYGLVKTFSGKGLVPQSISSAPEFLTAVAIGAAITVMVATVTGFPISTTHSLTGALVGAGYVAVGSEVNFTILGDSFFLPLLLSPVVALLLLIKGLSIQWGILAIAIGMAVGGLLNARKVAETMSNKITKLNHGQGFTANLVTSMLVIFASKLGMPVSTTHVSVGSLFGIGLITRRANIRKVLEILLSWFITLPVAAVFSGGAYLILGNWLFK